MKKYIFSIIFILSFSYSFSQLNTVSWQKDSIFIDGASFDWGTSFRYFDSKTRIRYNISNDSNYIYFCFQPVDEFVKSQILRAGMQIEFSPKVKPKRTAIIKYPQPLEKPDGKQSITNTQSFEEFFHSFQIFNNHYDSKGFVSCNGNLPLENKKGISVKFDRETNGLLCYELKIPIEELYGENYNLSVIAEKYFKIKLKVNSVTIKTKQKNNNNQAGMYPQNGRYGNNSYGNSYRANSYNQHTGSSNSFTIQGKTLQNKLRIADKPE